MPRYYFHTRNGATILDHAGADFVDDDAACSEALRAFGEFIRHGTPDVRCSDEFAMAVQEGSGRFIACLTATSSSDPPSDWPWRVTPQAK